MIERTNNRTNHESMDFDRSVTQNFINKDLDFLSLIRSPNKNHFQRDTKL